MYIEIENETDSEILMYILVDHMMSKLSRILDLLIQLPREKTEYCIQNFIHGISWTANVIIDFFRNKKPPYYQGELDYLLLPKCVMENYPRSQIEGDNHFISFTSANLLHREYSAVVGVALGGIACAAIISAYLKKPLGIVKLSLYDQVNNSQTPVYLPKVDIKGKILLVDDNCGTGRTLKQAAIAIKREINIAIEYYATELHWEKYFRCHVYKHNDDIFQPEIMVELSPWCFRHFKLIQQLIINEEANKVGAIITTEEWFNFSLTINRFLKKAFPEVHFLDKLSKNGEYIRGL